MRSLGTLPLMKSAIRAIARLCIGTFPLLVRVSPYGTKQRENRRGPLAAATLAWMLDAGDQGPQCTALRFPPAALQPDRYHSVEGDAKERHHGENDEDDPRGQDITP
jgi:hypothetical protein